MTVFAILFFLLILAMPELLLIIGMFLFGIIGELIGNIQTFLDYHSFPNRH